MHVQNTLSERSRRGKWLTSRSIRTEFGTHGTSKPARLHQVRAVSFTLRIQVSPKDPGFYMILSTILWPGDGMSRPSNPTNFREGVWILRVRKYFSTLHQWFFFEHPYPVCMWFCHQSDSNHGSHIQHRWPQWFQFAGGVMLGETILELLKCRTIIQKKR